MTDVLLCVGNSMMGDDGAGPLLAEMCAANPAGQWVVIDGGSAPENDIVAIRELRPERLLIVDATDMGLNPGDIRIIDPDDIAEMFMMTTHNMPLNYGRSAERRRRRGDFPRHSAGYRRFLLSDDPAGERGRCPGVSAAGRLAGQGRLYSAGGRGRLALRRTGLSAGARLAGREPRSRRCQLKILYH